MKLLDRSTLEMALVGYEAERQKIEAAIAAIRIQVDGHAAAPAVDGGRRPKRKHVGRSQAQDRGGAAEALGGVPRGEERRNVAESAEAEAVSGGQSEARGESRQSASRKGG